MSKTNDKTPPIEPVEEIPREGADISSAYSRGFSDGQFDAMYRVVTGILIGFCAFVFFRMTLES